MPKTPDQPAPMIEDASIPDWLKEVHKHYYQTGFYRPEDIQRVIGSQRDSVEIRAEADWPANLYSDK